MPVQDLTVNGSADSKSDLRLDRKLDHRKLDHKETSAKNPHAERPQKIGFVSLGCPKNLVDSEVMMGLLARAGAELTRRAEDADVIVVNTCSFIESAQQESVNTILEMAAHKATGNVPRNSLSPDAWSNASATRFAKTFPKSTRSSAPGSWKTFWPQPALSPRRNPVAIPAILRSLS
jgi:predicted membrane-bound mannosyltransferase